MRTELDHVFVCTGPGTPVPLRSIASQSIVENGILSSQDGEESLLEIEFDGGERNETADFRPHLPVVFQL